MRGPTDARAVAIRQGKRTPRQQAAAVRAIKNVSAELRTRLPRSQQPVLPKTFRFVDLRNMLALPGVTVLLTPVNDDGSKLMPPPFV